MKKKAIAIAIMASLVTACSDKRGATNQEPPHSEAGQQTEELRDSTCWGHLGEDTGMSALQFVTDQGDTLELYRTNPYTGEDGLLLGDIRNYTDHFALTLSADGESMLTAINATQLARKWQAQNGSITIKPDGNVEAEDMPYNGWKIWNGHILLSSRQQQEYGTVDRVDTMDIIHLADDSLAIRSHINQILTFTSQKR